MEMDGSRGGWVDELAEDPAQFFIWASMGAQGSGAWGTHVQGAGRSRLGVWFSWWCGRVV
jgi:hypothetical protein